MYCRAEPSPEDAILGVAELREKFPRQVRLERIPDIRKGTLQDFIRRTVTDEAEAIYTDELKSYMGVETETRRHETVNHSAESVWSLFKRSVVGTFHKMSVKHMDRYLEELEFRFNNRANPYIFRDTLARIMNTDPLEYRRLIAPVGNGDGKE